MLGPLEVTRDGDRVPVPGGKTSELVVRLALEAGAPVGADRLVDDLWSAGGRSARRNTLQSKVAMLRRAFGDPSVIESRDGGYALAVAPSNVDAIAALGVVGTASGLLEAGDDRGAADLCASTLLLYRGAVLQAAGDGEWVDPHRTRLEEARMQLLEIQFTARLRLGDVADVIGELEAAVATYPFQESLWELLITALYRAGRQADALATYQRVRQQLAEQLGLDPRPQLQELEQRILVQDPSLDLGSRLPERVVTARPTGNLPSMTAALVGRKAEMEAVCDLLADERLVEIVGPGGIGKTAVAIAVGRRLASSTDGVWLARLETATTADDVVDVLVSAVDGPGGEAALFERLKYSSAVVILDNCEHVVDAAADLAVRLLDAAPELRIICTSQVPLDIDGEVVFELAPLALADAVELFTRRATAQRTGPDRERGRGREVCSTCAALSTVCPWPSSSPRRVPRRCPSRRSPAASTTGSSSSATRPAADPNAAGPSGRPSDGATTCCSPTTSAACGRSLPLPAAHHCPPWSSSSKPSTCRRPRRSTWSAGSRAVRW